MATALPIRALHRLAGVAGILVGVFVLTFAFLGDAVGIAFAPEVRGGGSIAYWVDNVLAHPVAWRVSVLSLFVGFSAMAVAGFALCLLLSPARWQRYLALCGYAVGVPLALTTFAHHFAFLHHLSVAVEVGAGISPALALEADLAMQRWLWTATLFAPITIVVMGTGTVAWGALRDGLLPRWLCWWGMACAVLALLHFFRDLVPAFALGGLGAGPLHMLWFLVTGVHLLRRERTLPAVTD